MYKQTEFATNMFDSNLHIKIVFRIILTFFFAALFFPQFGAAQNKIIIAKKGDGIYRVLTKNGLSYSENLNAFIELNKAQLGKNNTLIIGQKYKLPASKGKIATSTAKKSSGKTVHYKIFGKKYADIEIKSNELKGATYYLLAGHGGPDPGAIGRYNGKQICEDEYAYDVIIRLARNLIEKGASVYMITRDKNDGIRDESYLKLDHDEVCYPNLTIPLNHIKRLRQRTNAINKLYHKNKKGFNRLVAIHVDSRSRGENIDVFFYHDKRSKTGKKAAQILQRTFQKKYNEHQPGRGYKGTVSTRNLYVVRNTNPVAVYIELANINHRRDIQRLIVTDNRQALANWLAEGLVVDYKTNR
jgi:N-acetylmuramoyl-L-alanine amidase